MVFLAEGGLEEQAAGHHTGGDVEGEEHQNHDTGDDAQHTLGVLEAVAQEDGDGHCVTGNFGVATQSRCHELPVAPRTDGQADGEPSLGEAAEVDGAGQAHEEPAGHVGCASRECGDGGGELSSTQHVVVEAVVLAIGPQADRNHGDKIYRQRDDLVCTRGHCFPSLLVLVSVCVYLYATP